MTRRRRQAAQIRRRRGQRRRRQQQQRRRRKRIPLSKRLEAKMKEGRKNLRKKAQEQGKPIIVTVEDNANKKQQHLKARAYASKKNHLYHILKDGTVVSKPNKVFKLVGNIYNTVCKYCQHESVIKAAPKRTTLTQCKNCNKRWRYLKKVIEYTDTDGNIIQTPVGKMKDHIIPTTKPLYVHTKK